MTTDLPEIAMPGVNDAPAVVVLADGDYPSGMVATSLLANAAMVVCCDGAAREFVARGGVPHAIVGDCDSMGEELRRRFANITHCNHDQETNDLTKAVRFCIAHGMNDITILGATGRREDHTLANISLLVDYAHDTTVRMVTDTGVFDPIFTDTMFDSKPGQQTSIFVLSPDTLITTIDLRYPLHRSPMPGWWCGSLNQSQGYRFGFGTTGPAIVYRQFPD
jgi:thiamine pyrophosphokinase